jgi:hypothetical protein
MIGWIITLLFILSLFFETFGLFISHKPKQGFEKQIWRREILALHAKKVKVKLQEREDKYRVKE